MNIIINDEAIELRYSFRALMAYEQILNKTFEPKGITEVITFFYCVIITSKKDLQFTYDEFLDMLDENPGLIKEFSEWLTGAVQRNSSLMTNDIKPDEKKAQKAKKQAKKENF